MRNEDTGPGITRYGAPDNPPSSSVLRGGKSGGKRLERLRRCNDRRRGDPRREGPAVQHCPPSPDARLKSHRHARIQTITIV